VCQNLRRDFAVTLDHRLHRPFDCMTNFAAHADDEIAKVV
jgi:hypothetical protein